MRAEVQDSAASEIILSTPCGEIRGLQFDTHRVFRGIRYATAERFEPPCPVTGWEGVYDGTVWGDRSCQYIGFHGVFANLVNQFYQDESNIYLPSAYSEDSLNLNIWTPLTGEKLPVFLFIHGGGFMTGASLDAAIDGSAYAEAGILCVTITYRLGAFSSPVGDGYTGNLHLRDQLAAIQWVRDNISAYGGDPRRIVIGGESAGAMSVQSLLTSPLLTPGMIAGAVMMSGGGDLKGAAGPTDPEILRPMWEEIKRTAGVSTLQELKALSAYDLHEAWVAALPLCKGHPAAPVRDGTVIPRSVMEALASGEICNVPCIITMTGNDIWPTLLHDAMAACGRQRAKQGGAPVYLAVFGRVPPGDDTFGAYHGLDIHYVFDTLCRNVRPMEDTDRAIARNIIGYIVNLCAKGDPNGEGLPRWEPAGADDAPFLDLSGAVPAMYHPDRASFARWQESHPAFPSAQVLTPVDVTGTPRKFPC